MSPVFRTAGRLANAGASFAFMLAVGRAFAAHEMSQWAVLGSVIGALTVLCGYPIRLGVFQFYPRYRAAGAPTTFCGHVLLLQIAIIGLLTAGLIAFYSPIAGYVEVIIASAALAGRIVFELVAELLRAQRAAKAERLLLAMYVLRSAALMAGAAFALIRAPELEVAEALGALSLSFLIPASLGALLAKFRPMIAGARSRNMARRVVQYLRYTVFLTIPFLLDSVTIYIERNLYVAHVPAGPAAEYFVWADLARYYFTLMGVLYAFEVLPDLLARDTGGPRRARFTVSSVIFGLAVICGLSLGIVVRTFEPGLVLGAKQSYADAYQFLCILLGAVLWMVRTQVLGIFFQARRQTHVHSLLAVICLSVFATLIAAAWAAGGVAEYFYFLVPVANLASLVLYLLYRMTPGAR